MATKHQRSKLKQKQIQVDIDYVVQVDSSLAHVDFVVLSDEVAKEIAPQGYVGLAPALSSGNGWVIMKVGELNENESTVKGKRVLVAGMGGDSRKMLGDRVWIQDVVPVTLDTVIFKVSDRDYDTIAEDHGLFQQFKSQGVVLRAGKFLNAPNGIKIEVALCEPVQQGILSEETEIILVTDATRKEQLANGVGTPASFASHTDSSTDLDIIQFLSLPSAEEERYTLGDASETEALIPPEDDPLSRGVTLRVSVLKHPVSRFSLEPRPSDTEDDEFRVYGHMNDIARIGVFSGDWVSLRTSLNGDKSARSVRLYASSIPRQGELYLPPILYANLLEPSSIQVTAIPPPSIPLSHAILVSRISSPASTAKSLESSFISSLKRYFESSQRIVRVGDYFALAIDETVSQFPSEDSSEPFNRRNQPNAISWYRVEKVTLNAQNEYNGDVYVDPASTKMLQSFYASSLIPLHSMALHSYLGIPHLPIPEDIVLTRSKPFSRLNALAGAVLSSHGRNANLSLVSILLHGQRGVGKRTLAEWVSVHLGLHFFEVNCYDILSESDSKTEAYLRHRFERANSYRPCLFLLRHIDAFARKRDVLEQGQDPAIRFVLADCLSQAAQIAAEKEWPLIVVGTTSEREKCSEGVAGLFKHEIEVTAPSEVERRDILKTITLSLPLMPDVSIPALALRTAALVPIHLIDMCIRADSAARDRFEEIASTKGLAMSDLEVAGVGVNMSDFDQALSEVRGNFSDSIGAPKIPNVQWDDVGGLADVKKDILDTIQLPLEHPELFAKGMKKRSGILLYGPPGTGKTLLAKAVATSFSLNFFSVKGPELLNMYIGESEANVRRVFQRARDARPCVVFFDELDSVAPRRGNQADSAGVMDRIVSQLLAELDGMSDSSGDTGVFVIGATNRPDLLDPALLRPGRFDKMLYLGVSQTHEQQVNIIRALTRKLTLSPDVDLYKIAETCPFTFTGADFYALCSDAQLKAMTRAADKVNTKISKYPKKVTTQWWFDHVATPEDLKWEVEMQDFMAARKELVPSVSAQEQETYRRLQSQFSGFNSDGKKGVTVSNGSGRNGKGKEIEINGNHDERKNGWVGSKALQQSFDENDDEYNALYSQS